MRVRHCQSILLCDLPSITWDNLLLTSFEALVLLIGQLLCIQAAILCAGNGIGLAVILPTIQSVVSELYIAKHRGRAFGCMLTTAAIGAVLFFRVPSCKTSVVNTCNLCKLSELAPAEDANHGLHRRRWLQHCSRDLQHERDWAFAGRQAPLFWATVSRLQARVLQSRNKPV